MGQDAWGGASCESWIRGKKRRIGVKKREKPAIMPPNLNCWEINLEFPCHLRKLKFMYSWIHESLEYVKCVCKTCEMYLE